MLMSFLTRILLGAAAVVLSSAWLSLVGMAAAAAIAAGPPQLDRPALSAYHRPHTVDFVHKG
jgi:hypothetical protein